MKKAVPAGRQGFTLIELMIVMIIMGILAAIGVSAFVSSQKKGRDTARKENIQSVARALELYYNDKGQYPTDDGAGGLKGCWATGGVNPSACAANQLWQDAAGTVYMPRFPADPSPNQRYYYVSAAGTQFQLYARLENDQDPQIIAPAAPGTSCGTGVSCNYGSASPNAKP